MRQDQLPQAFHGQGRTRSWQGRAFCVCWRLGDHYRRHRNPTKCARCYWGKHKGTLAPELTLKAALPHEVQPHAKFNLEDTWVVVAGRRDSGSTKNKYVFKCSICPRFVVQTLTIQKDSLTTHQTSKAHRLRLMEMCGQACGPTGLPIGGAPTQEEFKAAWIAAGKGGKISQRDATMQENILDADLECEQKCLESVETVCVSRDASRDGTLLVKAHACNSECDTKSAILGVCTDKGSTGYDLNKHTLKVYTEYFRRGCDASNPVTR